MGYYTSLLTTLLVFKAILLVVLAVSLALPKITRAMRQRQRQRRRSRLASNAFAATSAVAAASSSTTTATEGRRKASVSRVSIVSPWIKAFRAVFMVLFVAYPSVSVKIFRLFNCTSVEGSYWLTADMRLKCYTSEWLGYAVYAGAMGVVYVAGMPLTILALLYKRRDKLFGPGSEANQRMYGFLYDGYGPTAWFWDAEELVRKLLLTAIAVLMDDSNPLQVRWCIGSCVCSLVRSLIRWFAGSLVRWFVGSLRLILAMTCCCFTGVVSVVNENATSHVSCR